ncbi:hypothetical protein PTRG_02186 [Pyrenophora tritici-repentis Pt-1C-BFP]|uniref:Uncharacterized protein n=1 Tax=Pyrenophora tritici-repentis (strain Pt-1C-BFP) TaxID=426418 RepID=B2VV03_PYRTR|nr:uncharacterized protein PTRG_02186 [Pyrenophora tritici-repentis Pt-1C-BFP]EDU41624.1 hypothetical protein PTRG_02186 [Pyrenophora tritici-repentis Pt-1C-BFP]
MVMGHMPEAGPRSDRPRSGETGTFADRRFDTQYPWDSRYALGGHCMLPAW